jgi:hypothetical protein
MTLLPLTVMTTRRWQTNWLRINSQTTAITWINPGTPPHSIWR